MSATTCPECYGHRFARIPGRYGAQCPTCLGKGTVLVDEPTMDICVCGAIFNVGASPCHASTLEWCDAVWRVNDARDDGSHWHLTVSARAVRDTP